MASPPTPRYCKYFFSARGCNLGNECKYLHQQTEEVRMELPCTALAVDIETTGCWPGVHKIVAIGVALFQLLPTHQVVELDRRLFQFKVNYPQDFDEITMRDFWHVQGRMELLEALQNGAKCEEEAIKDFYDFYTEVCYRYPKFYMVTDNPVMDLGFIDLSIATKLSKPPLTYRPVLRSPGDGPSSPVTAASLATCLEKLSSPATSPSSTRSSPSALSEETESDDETSTEDGGEEADENEEDAFGESGEEDCGADDSHATAATAAATPPSNDQLMKHGAEVSKQQQQQRVESNKRLASFYDDYSAPHFAIDLNSFACGLIGLHLPPFRKAGGTRWASPADFLSFHKPVLICPFRKTHDPVDDASYNCWQFLQCVSILWMNEYAEIHQARKEELQATAAAGHHHHHQLVTKSGNNASVINGNSGAAKGNTNAKGSFSDAEFPTIAIANANANAYSYKEKKKTTRTPRRGRNNSTTAVQSSAAKEKSTASGPTSPMHNQQARRHQSLPPSSSPSSSSPSSSSSSSSQSKPTGGGGGGGGVTRVRRSQRSYSDPPVMESTSPASINTARALEAHEKQRTAVKVLF